MSKNCRPVCPVIIGELSAKSSKWYLGDKNNIAGL